MTKAYVKGLGFVELTEEIKSIIKSRQEANDINTEITIEPSLLDTKRTRKSKPSDKLAV